MPYVDIAQGNDFASLWYITNSPTGHVSSFDPDKPTVILLHPFFLNSTWLDSQFGDPRLNQGYNLIAFDQRAAGRTLSRPNGKQDSWTDAADLAFACHVRKMSFNCIPSPRRHPARHTVPPPLFFPSPSFRLPPPSRGKNAVAESVLFLLYERPSGYRRHTFGQVRRRQPTWVSASPRCTQPVLSETPVSFVQIPRQGTECARSRFPHMVLSLTMLSVPSPTECVSDIGLGCCAPRRNIGILRLIFFFSSADSRHTSIHATSFSICGHMPRTSTRWSSL